MPLHRAGLFLERCAPFATLKGHELRANRQRGRPAVRRRNTMQKSLHFDPAKCRGCLRCEMACSLLTGGAPGSSVPIAVKP